MSNRIVPATYRAIIDDVIGAVKLDFEAAGIEQDVLQELQNKWEMKVVASRVAQFEPSPPTPPPMLQRLPPPPPGFIKTEPTDSTFSGYDSSSSVPGGYADPNGFRPSLPALGLHSPSPYDGANGINGMNGMQGGMLGLNGTNGLHDAKHLLTMNGVVNGVNGVYGLNGVTPPLPHAPVPGSSQKSTSSKTRDGDSDPSLSDSSDSPLQHPTPSKPTVKPHKVQKARPPPEDDEEIGSDLDDSDEEEEFNENDPTDTGGAKDTMLCTYDKVQRVKNKWKCVLKDGIMHVNGRDYLFSKCTGEFEW